LICGKIKKNIKNIVLLVLLSNKIQFLFIFQKKRRTTNIKSETQFFFFIYFFPDFLFLFAEFSGTASPLSTALRTVSSRCLLRSRSFSFASSSPIR
jgi:hypothetical protein